MRVAPAPSMTRAPPRERPPPRCTAVTRWPSTRTSPANGAAPLPSKIVASAISVRSMASSSLSTMVCARWRVRTTRRYEGEPAAGGSASGRGYGIPDNQLGHGHAGAEARHELVGIVLDADRIVREGGSAEPVPSLLGGGEVVDLQLDPVPVRIAIVHGRGRPVIDAAK